jgi:hypothetical protein
MYWLYISFEFKSLIIVRIFNNFLAATEVKQNYLDWPQILRKCKSNGLFHGEKFMNSYNSSLQRH